MLKILLREFSRVCVRRYLGLNMEKKNKLTVVAREGVVLQAELEMKGETSDFVNLFT